MTKSEVILSCALLMMLGCSTFAQSNAGGSATVEPTMIVDKPTAGMLHRGTYALNGNFFERGGVLFGISIGLLDRFNFGISYGGTSILGADKPAMNPYPGVTVKLRILEESSVAPALAIGFDWQGRGAYVEDLKRYAIKSPGFYAVFSQNFALAGNFSLHGGLNVSTEREDGDKDLNVFVGAEKSVGRDISVVAEYDAGLNDNSANALGRNRGRGYFNVGLRWNWGRGLVLGLDLKDVFKNQQDVTLGNRTIQIEYVGNF